MVRTFNRARLINKLSRKALAAGAQRTKKTLGRGWATKPAASALPLSVAAEAAVWGPLLLMMVMLIATVASTTLFAPTASAQIFRGVQQANPEPESDIVDSGASLKTDPDLEALLEKAERYRADSNFRVATKLWQAVLQRSGDALYTRDRETYFSLVQEVEKTLSQLSPEGLSAYRITADAESKEILNASPSGDTTALSTVIRQYFISSIGDDAAYELGSIYLDRFDFTGALRLFEKIANLYPDPSVPLEQVYLRIALCHSYLGNVEAAQTALKESKAAATSDVANWASVEASLGQLSLDTQSSQGLQVWQTRLGNAQRSGVMPAPPAELMDQDLVALWQYYVEPKDTRYDRLDHVGFVRAGADAFSEDVLKTVGRSENNLITSWSKKDWRPAGQLLLDADQIFFRSPADIIVFDKRAIDDAIAGIDGSTGKEEKDQAQKPSSEKTDIRQREAQAVDVVVSWRSLWRNSFEIDQTTRMKEAMMRSWGGYGNRNRKKDSPRPVSMSEVQFFGDNIGSQMSIHGDYFYALEGPSYDEKNRHNPPRVNVQWNSTFRRSRSNFLTAYDRNSGSVRWRLPKTQKKSTDPDEQEVDKEFLSGGGFMSAPIGYGDVIIVPVNFGGAISVYALDPNDDGKTIWSSFLCDEPESSAQPWSSIQMSISGSDLLVNCGMGVVFTLDPDTGTVRFAKRYQRSGKKDQLVRRHGWNSKRMDFNGWSNDEIIAYGNQMIFFSSDQEIMTAMDRNTGQTIWECEYNPVGSKVDYLIGIYNDILYAGGFETIIAYDLKGQGRMLWGATQIFGDRKSRGRAMLTPAGVFVPVESAIIQYPLVAESSDQEIRPIASVEVNLGTGAPLGNLYSDGNRIFVQGGNRLYALGPKP
jgi:outer membrane protein assembly factor BamB/tetratricopeptide (TPR) repeat protein